MNVRNKLSQLRKLWKQGKRDTLKCIELERKLKQMGYDVEQYYRNWRNRNERELVYIRDPDREQYETDSDGNISLICW